MNEISNGVGIKDSETDVLDDDLEGVVDAEKLTREQAIDRAASYVVEIMELRGGVGANVGQSDMMNPLRDKMIGDANNEIYGLQAQTDNLISVHNLKQHEVLGKAFEKSNAVREFRDGANTKVLLDVLGIHFGPPKPQG